MTLLVVTFCYYQGILALFVHNFTLVQVSCLADDWHGIYFVTGGFPFILWSTVTALILLLVDYCFTVKAFIFTGGFPYCFYSADTFDREVSSWDLFHYYAKFL